jgi:hypothetical protein
MKGTNDWSRWRENAAFVAALILPWQIALLVVIVGLGMDRLLQYLDAKKGDS